MKKLQHLTFITDYKTKEIIRRCIHFLLTIIKHFLKKKVLRRCYTRTYEYWTKVLFFSNLIIWLVSIHLPFERIVDRSMIRKLTYRHCQKLQKLLSFSLIIFNPFLSTRYNVVYISKQVFLLSIPKTKINTAVKRCDVYKS